MAEVKTANPAPLGLAGFAATTFVLSYVNSGFLSTKDTAVVLGLALFYGGIAQLLAGMWAFRNGNTFQGTAFTSYGAFWLSFAALFLPGLGGAGAVVSGTAVGIYLLIWTIFTGIMLLGSFRTTGATVLVFLLLFVTFLLLALGALQGSTNLHQLGGYVGLATAVAAWYDALAGVMAGVSNGKIALPTFPLNG